MPHSHHIVIAGAGVIGRATALVLAEWGPHAGLEPMIEIGDVHLERAEAAASWVATGVTHGSPRVRAFAMPAAGSDDTLDGELAGAAILLDCLPWHQAVRMATLARGHDLHYANLTEHVESSRTIAALARGTERGFVLQTGLAPGFVDVLGRQLFDEFRRLHGVETVDALRLRVGALPRQALPPHYYGFTWSSAGVASEYLAPSVVVRRGEVTSEPSLAAIDVVRLGELVLEEALTSGGAADLPEALAGRVAELDYKTLRHPGHFGWVRERIAELPAGAEEVVRVAALEAALLAAVPRVEDDQVVVYAAAEGTDRQGVRRRHDQLLVIRPRAVGRHTLRAIEVTTASALAESARMLLAGRRRGLILQSTVDPDDFLGGEFVRRGYF